ncbi:MAG: AAA family ATPase [Sphingomonas bacterium]|nr:AAA family ATPase [Sphingomonas bacterium]
MYEDHFGLSGRPFQLTPDPKFWFETATHRKAMAYLGYGLAQGEGFIVITGDIGAGKTTLMGHLTDNIDPAALNVVKIVSTAIEADDLLRIVATALGVDPDGLTKAQLLTVIERGLHSVARTGRRTLLLVDEAQALPVSALEELRMLSNFQSGGHALVQIVLLGQPEFRDRLHGSDRLEQLRQRVIAIHHLDPMAEDEVADYIAHRLTLVGWQGKPDFAADAFAALFHGTDGVPRRLNQLAGRVMLHAAVEDIELIDGRVVRAVLRDLHADLPLLSIDRASKPVEKQKGAELQSSDEREADAIDPITYDMPVAVLEPEAPRRFVPSTPQWLSVDVDRDTEADTALVDMQPIAVVVTTDKADEEPKADVTTGWVETVGDPDENTSEAIIDTVVEEPEPAHGATVEDSADALDIATAVSEPASDDQRLAALEARIEQQDAALRRVLTLLVDWVEGEGKGPPPGLSPVRDDHDYAPIRGAAAWDDAA